jgi:hypothetical protein
MKNTTYYLGKMTYHKRNTTYQMPYVLEKDLHEFSFLKAYKGYEGKIPHLSVFEAYLVRQDEINSGGYVVLFKTQTDTLYFMPVNIQFAESIFNGDMESQYVGDNDDFLFEFRNMSTLKEITN